MIILQDELRKNNHKRCSPVSHKRPLDSQYYCLKYYAICFYLDFILFCNISFLRVLRIVHKLSDTDAGCVATALALCLKNVRNCSWIKKWSQRTPQYTQKKPHDRLNNVWAKRFFFWGAIRPSAI